MGKLNKLNVNNIYDTIGQNASTVEPAKKVIAQESEPAEEKKTGAVVDLLNPDIKKKKKSAAIYLRCKPEVKEKFEKLCEDKGISQADMFEFWVESLLNRK